MDSNDILKVLRENPPAKQFVPYCYLSEESDSLTVYFEGDADYSKRLSDHVTLYKSLETDEIVGCRIKGISGLLADLPNYVEVNHEGIRLSVVFLAFRGEAEEAARSVINDLAKFASEKNMTLQQSL